MGKRLYTGLVTEQRHLVPFPFSLSRPLVKGARLRHGLIVIGDKQVRAFARWIGAARCVGVNRDGQSRAGEILVPVGTSEFSLMGAPRNREERSAGRLRFETEWRRIRCRLACKTDEC